MDTNQRLLNPYTYADAKTETEERKQWLECIKLWKQRKDTQCIVIHGTGWHYNIDTDTCVKDS
jgi:hypothetical protein